MSNYFSQQKGVVNRYWKRPKPRVYECNLRDAERFYQQSYKDYLDAKEFAAKRASETRSVAGDAPSSSRWGIRRTNSLVDSSGDDHLNRSSVLNSVSSSRQYGEDSASSFRSSSLSKRNKSPDSDMASIEDRLQRLQKLRSELGLPSSEGGSNSKVSFALSSDTTGSKTSSRYYSPEPRERRGQTVDVASTSFSSTRTKSRGSDTSDSYGDKFSSGNEKSSRFSSKYNQESSFNSSDYKPKQNGVVSFSTEEPDKYSYKSSLKSERKLESNDDLSSYRPSSFKKSTDSSKGFGNSVKFEDEESSYSYKPSSSYKKSTDSSSTKGYGSSRKGAASESTDFEDYDADAFLSNMKKKFPTSEEILERIKKMDSDM